MPCCQTSLGTMIGGRLLIANHLVQSLWSANQKQGIRQISQPHHIYYTLLWWVLVFAVPFSSISKQYKNAGPKPFWWGKLACFRVKLLLSSESQLEIGLYIYEARLFCFVLSCWISQSTMKCFMSCSWLSLESS